MEKTKRLKKFNLNSIDEINEGTFENLVTWNLQPVEIVSTIKTTSGNRLVGIIRGEEYDSLHTFTLDGRCVGSTNGDLDLYIDDAVEVWFNLFIYENRIMTSVGYLTEAEAIKNKKDLHFDTVKVEVSGSEILSKCKEIKINEPDGQPKSIEVEYIYEKSL